MAKPVAHRTAKPVSAGSDLVGAWPRPLSARLLWHVARCPTCSLPARSYERQCARAAGDTTRRDQVQSGTARMHVPEFTPVWGGGSPRSILAAPTKSTSGAPVCPALMAPKKQVAPPQAQPREAEPPNKNNKTTTTAGSSCFDADAKASPAVPAAPTSCDGGTSATGAPPRPVLLASCSDADVNVLSLMRGIVAYVKFHLKAHMAHNPQFFSAFPNTELHEHPPWTSEFLCQRMTYCHTRRSGQRARRLRPSRAQTCTRQEGTSSGSTPSRLTLLRRCVPAIAPPGKR